MFIHPALTWGFFLALVPLLIHLINLVRRRRVKWAAMEFLLQSYKKHQKWIWLQQLLLLFLRMLAIAVIVAMLAQWVSRSHWLSLFGGHVTHHYILLDDSFSMSERHGGMTAFDKATQVLSRIASQAMAQDSPQKITLLRFSRAAGFRKDDTSTAIGQLADLNAEPVDANFDVLLEEKRRSLQVSQLSVGPRPAWQLTTELLRQSQDETNFVHVLSDFRDKDWASPAEMKQLMEEVDRATEQIELVDCTPDLRQTNLAITDLRPADEVRAAGVPLLVNVSIANFGRDAAQNVPVRIRSLFYDPDQKADSEPGKAVPRIDEPPALLIEDLGAGQTTTRQVQVFFPEPGEHVVQAELPEDVVAFDNRRWCVIDIPAAETVLAIDGHPEQLNSYYLTSAFQPGPRAPTGIQVDTRPATFLRDATREELAVYRAIYLLDVDRLEDRAVQNIESFVQAGGGLAIFAGSRMQHTFYTSRLHRDGAGVFPVPIEREEPLIVDSGEDVPDLQVTDHPLFSVFLGERNPFIRLVNIHRYLRPPLTWSPAPDSTVQVIARLRNRQPLVIEQKFGAGRVVAFLTTLSPEWNNWANDPSFVVTLLKLQSYLAAPLRPVEMRQVGSPLAVSMDATRYRKDVVFVVPGLKQELPLVLQRTASAAVEAEKKQEKTTAEPPLNIGLPGTSADDANTARSGIYEVWQATVSGPFDVHRYALNVDPVESNLAQASPQALLASLSPVSVRLRDADEFAFDLTEQGALTRSTWLILVVLLLLVAEQLVAYLASYHPVPAKGVAAA